MKIGNMKESKYLKKEDVGEGMVATIKAISQTNVAMENQPEDIKYILSFNENLAIVGDKRINKAMVLNWTNTQLCARACQSEETDDWIGKKIVLFNDRNVSYGGEMIGGIRIRSVTQGTASQAGTVTPSASTKQDESNPPPFIDDSNIPF